MCSARRKPHEEGGFQPAVFTSTAKQPVRRGGTCPAKTPRIQSRYRDYYPGALAPDLQTSLHQWSREFLQNRGTHVCLRACRNHLASLRNGRCAQLAVATALCESMSEPRPLAKLPMNVEKFQ